eukprot:8825276-Alexandrium_andersonii.AAC.1
MSTPAQSFCSILLSRSATRAIQPPLFNWPSLPEPLLASCAACTWRLHYSGEFEVNSNTPESLAAGVFELA